MSFISVFDVMGPNMIGPSSSHTAELQNRSACKKASHRFS